MSNLCDRQMTRSFDMDGIASDITDRARARIIHEHFCCNRRFAATTGLRPAGSPLGPSPCCMSTHRGLRAPRAGLATRLSDFATNRHEQCGLAHLLPYCSTRCFCMGLFPQDLDIANGVYSTCRVSHHDHGGVLIMRYVAYHSHVVIEQSCIRLNHSSGDLCREVAHQRRCHHVHLTNPQRVSRS